MSWVTTSGQRGGLAKMALVAATAGLAAVFAAAPAIAAPAVPQDLGCPLWHPQCPWADFGTLGPADDGIPGDNAADGGIPAPASVPNVDGSLSPPGMPGDV